MKKFLIWVGIGLLLLILTPSLGVWYVLISGFLWGSSGVPKSNNSNRRTTEYDDYDSTKHNVQPFRDENGVYETYTSFGGIKHYSNGKRSYTDWLGNEHFDDGVVAYDTLRGDKEYIKDGEYLGSSYEDITGTTRYYR